MITDEHVNSMVYCVDIAAGKVLPGVLCNIVHNLTDSATVLHGRQATVWPPELIFTSEKQAKEALSHGTKLVSMGRVPAEVSRRQPVLRDDQRPGASS